jgi:hypothetical protein
MPRSDSGDLREPVIGAVEMTHGNMALDTVSVDAGYCRVALPPTRVKARKCIRALGASEGASWIRVRGLSVPSLHFA